MIRPARAEDIPALIALVNELATYERAADEVQLSATDLETALFGDHPAAFAHVAVHGGEVVGMALWFLTFSTWTGRHGIWLEDLVIRQELRGHGYGRALLTALARIAVERGYARLEWAVLDWNEPAIGFYRHLGSAPQQEWTTHRISGDALDRLAGLGS